MTTRRYVLTDQDGKHYWMGGRFLPADFWAQGAHLVPTFASPQEAEGEARRLAEQHGGLRVAVSPWPGQAGGHGRQAA